MVEVEVVGGGCGWVEVEIVVEEEEEEEAGGVMGEVELVGRNNDL